MKAKKLIKDDIIGVCAPSDCIKEKNIKDLETSKNAHRKICKKR